MRSKEGANLGRDLAKRLASLRRITKRVAKQAPKVVGIIVQCWALGQTDSDVADADGNGSSVGGLFYRPFRYLRGIDRLESFDQLTDA